MEQPSKDFAVAQERLDSEEISEIQREECATTCTGGMTQNHAIAHTHQTWPDKKNIVTAMDRTGSVFKYLVEKSLPFNEAKIKDVVSVDLLIRRIFIDDIFNNILQDDEKKKGLGPVSSVN
jgi:hypothetical protein